VGTNGGLGRAGRGAIVPVMKTKRLLAAVLWFFTGWYAWNFLAAAMGLSGMLGPISGIALAAAIVWLPSQRWAVPAPTAPARVQPES
jgi:hypothetical protein